MRYTSACTIASKVHEVFKISAGFEIVQIVLLVRPPSHNL